MRIPRVEDATPWARLGPLVRLGLILCALCLPGVAAAESVQIEPGLVWNRTGLPAVFPLQVKTDAGQDYFLILRDAATGEDRLAAYVRGGEFFRVLVPPGSFTLHFDYGQNWQGEGARFGAGADAGRIDLPTPQVFETLGAGVKAGHVVDLREPGAAAITGQFICQGVHYEYDPAFADRPAGPRRIGRSAGHPARGNFSGDLWLRTRGFKVRSRYCK